MEHRSSNIENRIEYGNIVRRSDRPPLGINVRALVFGAIKALKAYEEKNIKFADAVMGFWGLGQGYPIVFTYDEKAFKRLAGLDVRKP